MQRTGCTGKGQGKGSVVPSHNTLPSTQNQIMAGLDKFVIHELVSYIRCFETDITDALRTIFGQV